MYIYEAGSLTYFHDNNQFELAIEWRDRLDKWASDNFVKTFNPAKTFLKEKAYKYSKKAIVQQNDSYLEECTIMVVQLDNILQSPGTQYEIVKFKTMGKTVIAFGDSEGCNWSPHIDSCITQYCETIEDVINMLCVMFDQNNF